MLSLKTIGIAAIVVAIGLAGSIPEASAGVFDKLRLRPKATRTATVRRGQSPQAAYARSGYSPPASDYQQASYSVESPCYSTGDSWGDSDCCCGPKDCLSLCKRCCRMCCDQTYYCPVPPYCYACYGQYPTCWSRMQECQLCPQTVYATDPAPRPRRSPPAKKIGPPVPPPATDGSAPTEPPAADDLPAEPPAGAFRRPPANRGSIAVGLGTSTGRSRWTGYADTVVDDEEIPEAPADTLEEQIASEDLDADPSAVEEEEQGELGPETYEEDVE